MTYMASFHSTSQEDVTSRDRRPGAIGGREIGDEGGDTSSVLGRRKPRLEGPTGGNTREDGHEPRLDDAAMVERQARDEPLVLVGARAPEEEVPEAVEDERPADPGVVADEAVDRW